MLRLGLALGGGAVRGIAHIGVLKALEELRIPVSYLAGTSSGSIIGSLVAAGYTHEQLAKVVANMSWRDLGSLQVPRRSLLDNERMEQWLSDLMPEHDFTDLKLPFAAVCTDLHTAERVVLKSGNVVRAVRASCSVPGMFEPIEDAGRLLVDGGLVENVPVRTARELGAELVISVDLYASAADNQQVDGIMGMIMRSFEIMQRQQQCHRQSDVADVDISPEMSGVSLIDFGHVDQYIQFGYQATMAKREQLLQLLRRASATAQRS